MDRVRAPLVILGIDAGDPGFIERWAQQGHLPTVATVMERGAWGRTAGPELVSEHGVWVSLFSGISRSQHGYYYYRQLKPGTYDLEAKTGLDVDAPPFWSQLQGRSQEVALIDVPDTRPLRGLPGLQLYNWATHNNWDPAHFPVHSEPPELLDEVLQAFGPPLVTLEKHESTYAEDLKIYHELLARVAKKGALCRSLIIRGRFDLVAIVFAEPHAANHQFWRYCPEVEPALPGGEHELRHAIRAVYQAVDYEIGRLLALLPPETNLFLVSSVGMADKYPTTGLSEAFFRELGYQATPQASDRPLRPIDLVRRAVPEPWRVALSRRLPRERREQLLADQFRSGTAWRQTTAFALPSAYTTFVRVNLRGREPQGIVEPGAEYEALLDRIEADLRQLVEAGSGEPAVVGVSKTVDLYRCGPPLSLPDLFVDWKPGRFMRQVVHPRAELGQQKPDFYRRSDHGHHGFVAAMGPAIVPQEAAGEVPVLDLAPTFLHLLGVAAPPHLSGRALEGWLVGRR